ncbi:MAG TPA: ABC transporter ATP-binding protein [Planctomycetota bacterium]|nr:ABC transporter ATP-binding protein [Planctomycetota bacterium]
MATAIRFENVGKRFMVAHQRPFLAKELVRLVLQKPSTKDEFWALRGVNFEIGTGESVAILGTNGSGKSTTLALVAQTTTPTEGKVIVNGRIGPLLELGAGFHPDLTGYENIYLNASLLGLSRREVDAKLEKIIEYAGIGTFIDAPIQTYSTGMKARLGFSVIAHIDPDILLLDEVLAVGDGQFAQKCEATIRNFQKAGKTLCFVSHSPTQVMALCERAIWLYGGRVQAMGEASMVCERYQRFLDTGDLGAAPMAS